MICSRETKETRDLREIDRASNSPSIGKVVVRSNMVVKNSHKGSNITSSSNNKKE